MLSNEMKNKLNEQAKKEMQASNLYLSMGFWCLNNKFDGAGEFFIKQSEEENEHAKKIMKYLSDKDAEVVIEALDKPESKFDGLLDVFKKAYNNEVFVTKCINELVDYALNTKDFTTLNFLQWYVEEQHEEETLFKGIIDKIELIGNNSLYLADKYIKSLTQGE